MNYDRKLAYLIGTVTSELLKIGCAVVIFQHNRAITFSARIGNRYKDYSVSTIEIDRTNNIVATAETVYQMLRSALCT